MDALSKALARLKPSNSIITTKQSPVLQFLQVTLRHCNASNQRILFTIKSAKPLQPWSHPFVTHPYYVFRGFDLCFKTQHHHHCTVGPHCNVVGANEVHHVHLGTGKIQQRTQGREREENDLW